MLPAFYLRWISSSLPILSSLWMRSINKVLVVPESNDNVVAAGLSRMYFVPKIPSWQIEVSYKTYSGNC